MGLALLVVITLITLIGSYFFAAHTWWLPAGAAAVTPSLDRQFDLTFICMGVVFIAAQVGLGLFAWKYRDRGQAAPAHYSHGNTKLEAVWTTLTAILFFGLLLIGSNIWARERFAPAGANALPVEITGMQFAWYFRYPGPDGKYAPTKPELIDPSSGGLAALGVDTDDPSAKDDVVVNTLVLPVNRQVDVTLRSEDVIHSFFIPNMRFKQDAVPGLAIHVHFTPDKVGEYEVACAELCGLGHYKMRATVKVVSEQDYQAWMAEREAEKQ